MSDDTTTPTPFNLTAWIASQSDTVLLACTLMAEARGEDTLGRQMVANAIMNRVQIGEEHLRRFGAPFWWGSTLREVILKPWQFSCWNENDPNRAKMPGFASEPLWAEVMVIADQAIQGVLADAINGADSYLNPAVVTSLPAWAVPDRMTVEHLHHRFYRTI